MNSSPADPLEELLAEALAVFDDGGESGLEAFLAAHPAQRAQLVRAVERCRQMGLLGTAGATRDFPDRLGEFQLLRRLGSGGMGIVYEAEQASLRRRVALKVVRPELLYFEGARERFRREIEAVAQLSHPAIVPVLASGEQDGLQWYAMELLAGRSANDVCLFLGDRDPAQLTADDLREALGAKPATGTDPFAGSWWQVCVRIVHQLALGVRHAHLRGTVHRDIKPGNVMLMADGRAVLLDFGVAMVAGSAKFTQTGGNPGSPAFMSPEQLRGDAVDERTDIYSLAATLWQLLTLEQPFDGVNDLQRIRDGEIASVRSKNREVPHELALVLETAMDRDRERRYANVEAFADDLQAVLQRQPIRARRLSRSLRVIRWCQRHRVAATAMACLLLVALALPVVFAWRERGVNAELQVALSKAQMATVAAEDSLASSLHAMRALLVRVADEQLRHVPAADRVAREALADACAMYRELLPKHPEHVRLRGDAARAMTRYGVVLRAHGDSDAADAVLREAVAALGGEDREQPAELLVPRAVAKVHIGSQAVARRDMSAADVAFTAAQADLEPLQDVAKWRREVLRTRIELAAQRAALFDEDREASEVERGYASAVAMARELLQLEPENVHDRRHLVERLDVLATFYGHRRRYVEAEPLLLEALALANSIPIDAPFWPPQPLLVADVQETIGLQCVEQKDQRAVAALKLSFALREKASLEHPHDVAIRSDLAAALHNLAYMNFRQAQDERAMERLERAIELQRSVIVELPQYGQAREYLRNHLTLRGSVANQLGRLTELHASCVELTAMSEDRRALRSAARLWLRLLVKVAANEASSGQSPSDQTLPSAADCGDRAVQCLQTAVQLGWGVGNRFDERVYDAIRSRPEFVALQRQVVELTR